MAYTQHTKCTSRSNYIGKWAAQVIIAAAIAALPLMFGAAVLPGVGLVVFGAIIAYCRWWLYDRLICLGGDVCALGWVVTVEPPSEKSGLDIFDTDYSFSLCLAPHTLGATQTEVESDGMQGKLIKQQKPETDGLDWAGYSPKQYANYDGTASLHCEFEGSGVYDLMIVALIAYGLCVAAAILMAIPGIGWALGLILAILAWLLGIGGSVVAANDQGNPNDVDANLGEIHANDPTRIGADILIVKGTWVYDSAHEGWNEIHPIKHCQKTGTWGGRWDTGAPTGDDWCEAIGEAEDPLTISAQGEPENQWETHPVIDGCDPGDDPDGEAYPMPK